MDHNLWCAIYIRIKEINVIKPSLSPLGKVKRLNTV